MTRKKLTLLVAPALLLIAMLASVYSSGTARADTPTPDTPTPTATPTSTPSPTPTGTPKPVTINVLPSSRALTCSASTTVTVSVFVGGAPATDGTAVQLSTTLGFITPTTSTTTAGGSFAQYYAPTTGGGTAVLSATALGVTSTTTIALSCGATPPQLNLPQVACAGNSATATFIWTPVVGAINQYLDLTLADNGFGPGTFLGAGPLDPATNQIFWNGLVAGQPHFWRVNALTAGGWLTSATGAFVPCGAPATRQINYVCTGNGRANVTFNWAASAPPAITSYLDLTIFDNGFAPGTFVGTPVGNGQSLTWPGILANTTHYWRINGLLTTGWGGSTGTFTATC